MGRLQNEMAKAAEGFWASMNTEGCHAVGLGHAPVVFG